MDLDTLPAALFKMDHPERYATLAMLYAKFHSRHLTEEGFQFYPDSPFAKDRPTDGEIIETYRRATGKPVTCIVKRKYTDPGNTPIPVSIPGRRQITLAAANAGQCINSQCIWGEELPKEAPPQTDGTPSVIITLPGDPLRELVRRFIAVPLVDSLRDVPDPGAKELMCRAIVIAFERLAVFALEGKTIERDNLVSLIELMIRGIIPASDAIIANHGWYCAVYHG